MFDLSSLIKRHILNFLRDKTAVFISFFSAIILVALYILFIGRQVTDGNGLTFLDPKMKIYLTTSIMMGGVLIINTISLSLGMMGNLTNDLVQKKLDAFLVTPVKRYKVILSYYLSVILVTVVFSIFMWILAYFFVGISSGYWYSFETVIYTILLIIFFTFLSSSLMIYLTTLLKSINAFGMLSGVLGTVIGVASGIYIPLFIMGETITKVASIIPFTHMAIILRRVLLKGPYDILLGTMSVNDLDEVKVFFGTNEIPVLGMNISLFIIMVISSGISLILLYLAYRNMIKKIIK
jgi:multidrug/hemolysin transport system permease protein